MPLSENAVSVLEARYLLRDKSGELIESPEQMFRRVAKHVGQHETHNIQIEFFDMMSRLDFLPNSPTLANAGKPEGQLSACFVLPVEDSMDSIFSTMRDMALVHKSGGGTGFSFNRIRGKGSMVKSTAGMASGPIPFMTLFDRVSETVKQGGMRHGANMGIMNWDHPDIYDFIHMKDGMETLTNFNISVGVTDINFWGEQRLFEHIYESAWLTGDPGLVFLNRMNQGAANPVPSYGPIEATNPCGEQPLYPYDSCNLGSINLANFYNPATGNVDYERLGEVVKLVVRFLDDVITTNHYPLKKIKKTSEAIRRIGLGVMGWADLLYKLRIPYSSSSAQNLGTDVMKYINVTAFRASEELAAERGPFPEFVNSIYADGKPIRNSTRTTIAPTGTISIIAGCSSGIEPNFNLYFERRHKINREDPTANVVMHEVNPVFADWLYSNQLSIEDFKSYSPAVAPGYFETAHDIPWMNHLLMQVAFQKYTDNAVSKTINFPNSATPLDIRDAYRAAWELGAMGITVYRDGCRAEQVLSMGALPPTPAPNPVQITSDALRRRMPVERETIGRKVRIGEHEGYLHAGKYEDGQLGEVFFKMDREGSTVSSLVDCVCIAVSIGLQYGVPLSVFIEKYKGARFEPSGFTNDPEIRNASSIMDYIARWLERKFINTSNPPIADVVSEITMAGELVVSTIENFLAESCPDCNALLMHSEGCVSCSVNCGYSRC